MIQAACIRDGLTGVDELDLPVLAHISDAVISTRVEMCSRRGMQGGGVRCVTFTNSLILLIVKYPYGFYSVIKKLHILAHSDRFQMRHSP